MKALNMSLRDKMFTQRKFLFLDLGNLAVVLNCPVDHMVAAQIGLPVPDDVYNAVVEWLET